AMKLIGYAQSKIKDKKNKKPNQVSNNYGTQSSGNDNTNLLLQMIANQQKQLDALMEIARSSKGIENKPVPTEEGFSRKQGKRAQMMSYNMGGAF
ncbi:MAG: hypothetical protein L0I85_06975, partial [Staphylococcus equorum]|nr:hypothetical protein [Staphylococcus equorum]